MELVTPQIGLLFWTLLAFLTVLFILKKFAWKPILKTLKERQTSINAALNSAKKAREDMAQLSADNERILNEAKIARDNLLKEAKETKASIIGTAKAEAEKEAKKILDSARQGIENEKSAALHEMKNRMATLSVEIAEKILKEELSKDQKQSTFIDGLLKDINLN